MLSQTNLRADARDSLKTFRYLRVEFVLCERRHYPLPEADRIADDATSGALRIPIHIAVTSKSVCSAASYCFRYSLLVRQSVFRPRRRAVLRGKSFTVLALLSGIFLHGPAAYLPLRNSTQFFIITIKDVAETMSLWLTLLHLIRDLRDIIYSRLCLCFFFHVII